LCSMSKVLTVGLLNLRLKEYVMYFYCSLHPYSVISNYKNYNALNN